MASGYPGREYLLKRTLPEQQQQSQQLQQALFLRSVKPKAVPLQTSPISPLDLSHVSSASSTLVGCSFPPVGVMKEPEPEPEPESESEKKTVIIMNRLQELERQLLLDDDDEDEESAVTNNEWNDTIQQLISPLSPSPTSSSSSSSSTASSAASSSSRQLLLDTANSISDGNLDTAAANLTRLKQAANPRGDPDQRLTAIMVSALVSRLNPSPSASHPFADFGSTEHLAGTAMLHEVSPVFKLGLVAANLAILDATRGHLKIHIIDFDVGQGVQYVAFIHALADNHRHNPSSRLPAVKITAVADPSLPFHASHLKNNNSNLRLVGEGLARLAEGAGVGLRFNIVCRRPSELDRSTLGCEPGEALAVNFAFLLSRVADESVTPANPRDELLRRVKSLSPLTAILVEQDMNTNTAPFAPRFAEVCAHYGALLDSLHANPKFDIAKRARVEACIARKATNAVARDGADRVERCEVFGKWRARMGMAGFTPSPLTASISDPIRARLGSLRPNPGFTLKEDAGGLCLGWHGRVLTVASAWR